MQFRAAVKSKNRQDWIEKLRGTLTKLMENIPTESELRSSQERVNEEKRAKCVQAIWELEFRINPSEPDHRVLLTLSRLLISRYTGYDPFRNQNNSILDTDAKSIECLKEWKTFGDNTKSLNFQLAKTDEEVVRWCDLKNMVAKLSQAVLKKEWERVKRGM
ncbi:hypothetical protein GCM10011332_26260 [Terasakiella brassicae]|uniref:PH domain-containing protein n=1 Tax=Terasakiella brassicae TaxID=1634917 RepID=A0A917C5D2_9PROT|nr:hypothetical protein GCM10011332_26260 [Terasakiella brassicae]